MFFIEFQILCFNVSLVKLRNFYRKTWAINKY